MYSKSEFDHAVGARLDYGFKWSLDVGETIADSTWSADAGVIMEDEKITSNVTSLFVDGLVEGNVYVITNTIKTSKDREDSRSLVLSCKRRFP